MPEWSLIVAGLIMTGPIGGFWRPVIGPSVRSSVGAANFLMIIGLIVGGRVLLETGASVAAMRCACMLAISLTAA
jgi:hypothetical protein